MADKKKTKKDEGFSEETIKHLEFIQGGINRFASNSFQMKGWMLTIVSALLGFYANSNNTRFALVAVVPVVIFWILDSYYLQLERQFRGIYNDVTGLSKDAKPVRPFEMPIQNYTEGKYSFWDVFFSKWMMLLYFPVILLLLGIHFFL